MIEQALFQELLGDFFPVFKRIPATERYAITLGGSHGKGIADRRSDFDFRIYFDECVSREQMSEIHREVGDLVARWKQRGVEVDGVWPRSVRNIDAALDKWLCGEIEPKQYEWTVWGYHVLTDIYNQQIVEDPFSIAADWKTRLSVYPPVMKAAIVKKYASSLTYWRNDYHYMNKVMRGDLTFLAYLTARLVHDIMQIVYALNEFYFPGDGMNLRYVEGFSIKPVDFVRRVERILYPGESGHMAQYEALCALIDDVLKLI